MLILQEVKLCKCFVVSSHVPTLKHEAKHGYVTQKRLFQLLHETNKQLFQGHIIMNNLVIRLNVQ